MPEQPLRCFAQWTPDPYTLIFYVDAPLMLLESSVFGLVSRIGGFELAQGAFRVGDTGQFR